MPIPQFINKLPRLQLYILILSICLLLLTISFYLYKTNQNIVNQNPRDIVEPSENKDTVTEVKQDQFNVKHEPVEGNIKFEAIINNEIAEKCKDKTCIVSIQVKTEGDYTDLAGSEFNLDGQNFTTLLEKAKLTNAISAKFKIQQLGEMGKIDAIYYSQEITF